MTKKMLLTPAVVLTLMLSNGSIFADACCDEVHKLNRVRNQLENQQRIAGALQDQIACLEKNIAECEKNPCCAVLQRCAYCKPPIVPLCEVKCEPACCKPTYIAGPKCEPTCEPKCEKSKCKKDKCTKPNCCYGKGGRVGRVSRVDRIDYDYDYDAGYDVVD